MMEELQKFVEAVYNSYMDLSYFNKSFVGGILVYMLWKILKSSSSFFMKNVLFRRQLADDPSKTVYNPTKVYLHIFPRCMTEDVPNGSPFVLKVETWIRMAGIEHEVIETVNLSRSTQQMPYIFHKGIEIADSDFIIEYLQKEFKPSTGERLGPEDKAISRAFSKMADESLFGTYITHRTCFDNFYYKRFHLPVPWFMNNFVLSMIIKDITRRMHARGIGRKSPKEVHQIGNEDIRAISLYLGKKKYLMGDEMSYVDCTVFGHLSQIMLISYQDPFTDFITNHCPNIMPYLERIKQKCWPDWKEIIPKHN